MSSRSENLRLRRQGSVLIIVGVLVIPTGLLVPIDMAWPLVLTAGLGSFLISLGRRFLAKARATQALADPRRAVLDLRPFDKDERAFARWYAILGNYGVGETREESLARIMSQAGPFIAIGKPGERLPPLGAIRKHVNGAEWKHVVSGMVKDAAFVIIRIGSSPGLIWELCQVCEMIEPKRLVLFHPFDSWIWRRKKWEDEYASFRSKVLGKVPCRLPLELGRCELMTFTDDWKGCPHEAEAKSFLGRSRDKMSGSLLMALREGLRPAFDALKMPLPTVPFKPVEYVVMVFYVCVAALTVYTIATI